MRKLRVNIETIDSGTGCRTAFMNVIVPELSGPAITNAYWTELKKTGWEGDVPPVCLAWVEDDERAAFVLRDGEEDACMGRVMVAGFAIPMGFVRDSSKYNVSRVMADGNPEWMSDHDSMDAAQAECDRLMEILPESQLGKVIYHIDEPQ